jgi:hypothetical protein
MEGHMENYIVKNRLSEGYVHRSLCNYIEKARRRGGDELETNLIVLAGRGCVCGPGRALCPVRMETKYAPKWDFLDGFLAFENSGLSKV